MQQQVPQLENSYNKVIATIESCKTKNQLESASRMVKNFKMLYKQVGYLKTISYSLDETLKQQYIITRCQL
jgi:hypothetical protein